jgi:hypothetical protein
MSSSDSHQGEDLIGDARVRAKRLIEDLSRDADDLRAASNRVIRDEDRRETQALLADAIAASQRLHDALNRTTK